METVYVGIGSNCDRESNISSGISMLKQRFGALQLSPVYESRAVGFDGDNFYNLVAGFTTGLEPEQLVDVLHEIEGMCKRDRANTRFASRTRDLDLLMYGNLVRHTGKLRIPRDEIVSYAFVLKPLADIAGSVTHPVSGSRIEELWKNFPDNDQELWPVQLSID
jgi:2-amino-4-hydroxy-6-hydroxymethyldihydropteridine diphosphokinase